MSTVTTTAANDTRTFRQRLLDGLAESIVADGYRGTTVADIVRSARTSRRTFYEHFAGKEECFIALLTEANTEMIRQIAASVNPESPWQEQVRQAVRAWIAAAESEPAITVSWIRDLPSLGPAGRLLQRGMMDAFADLLQLLCDTDEWRRTIGAPISRQLAFLLLGGLRELMAATVEDGGRISDITDVAVNASIALVRPVDALS